MPSEIETMLPETILPETEEPGPTRRSFLRRSSCGLGSLALSVLLTEQARAESPLAPKASHFPAKAKRVVFLFMEGGPSQMDLLDYKPRLAKDDGKPLPFKLPDTEATVGLDATRLLGPISKFDHRGQSGLFLSNLLPEIGRHADDLCVLRAMQSDSPNHPVARTILHTGTTNDFWPSMGAWISYGLGTENQQLPSYVTILPREGTRNYGSAFLPAIHQGTPIEDVSGGKGRAPIRHLVDPSLPRDAQRKKIEFLQRLNRAHLETLQADQAMEGVLESFELAFRMQTKAPEIVDLSRESKATRELYGIGGKKTDRVGRQCLLARRLLEAGVRFVQVSMGGWDHHGSIRSGLPNQCAMMDRPVASLLTDLKNRGLLEDTLVVWAGEFGRTPHHQDLSGNGANVGREHNPHGFSIWLAGGGVRGGIAHGETDEYGYRGISGKVHIHDLHATMLHLLGLDHERLTYRHKGRDFRLTDVEGHVVRDILA